MSNADKRSRVSVEGLTPHYHGLQPSHARIGTDGSIDIFLEIF